MVKSIQYVHQKKIIHRDLNLNNFMLGNEYQPHRLFLIDFGLAKSYIQKNGNHISFETNKPFKGTVRFSSLESMKGYEQSRRDDLVSIVYMMIFMLKGSLPWT